VKLIGPALGHEADHAPVRLPELSRERVRVHLELFDRVQQRDHPELVVHRDGVHPAVQVDLVTVGWSAVETDLGECLIVNLGKPVRASDSGLHAGDKPDQVQDVPAIEWEVFNPLPFDGPTKAGVFRLHPGDAAGYGNSIGHLPDLEHDVEPEPLPDFEDDARLPVS